MLKVIYKNTDRIENQSHILDHRVLHFCCVPFIVVILNSMWQSMWELLQLTKCFILDQEDVVKMMIGNDSEILNSKIAGEWPIHFAARNSKHWSYFQGKNILKIAYLQTKKA